MRILPWQQNFLHFSAPFILSDKCAKFYLIPTSVLRIAWDLNIELIQVLLVTSQFLLKGHKMLNFLLAIFLEISEVLKANISGTETDINKG